MREEELAALWEGTLGPAGGWSTLSAGQTLKPGEGAAEEATPLAQQTLSELGMLAGGTLSGQATIAPGAAGAGRTADLAPSGFDLIEEIGQGGMGVVYRARQSSLRREVAVKTLRPGQGAPDKFVSEALVTGVLDHPNIVPVHELGRGQDGEVTLAMKLVKGTGWDRLLHPQTEDERARAAKYDRAGHIGILLAVCNAVAFAHTKAVIHRDLKPENVMVGEFGEVLVMDWGIAVDVGPQSRPDGRAPHRSTVRGPSGTPSYMAPEMAEGRGEALGPWTDVYLLGAILHELLTGRPPHTGPTLLAVLLAASRSEPKSYGPEIPDAYASICRRAMAREPAERWQTVGELQAALEEVLSHRESLTISARASAELTALSSSSAGQQSGKSDGPTRYEGYARVVARYEQALELWDGNVEARSGTRSARLAYARVALAAGDFGLAEAQLAPIASDPEAGELLARIRAAAAQRARAARNAGLLRIALILAAVVIVAGLSVGLVLLRQKEQAARDAAAEARVAESKARTSEAKARQAEGVAKTERDIAAQERAAAVAAKARAEENEKVARSARAEAVREAWGARLQLARTFDDRATNLLAAGKGREAMACLLRAVELAPPSRIPSGYPTDPFAPGWARGSWRRFQLLRACLPQRVRTLDIPRGLALAVDPKGERVAVLLGKEEGIGVWELESLQRVATLKSALPNYDTSLSRLALDPGGRHVAACYRGQTIFVIDVAKDQAVAVPRAKVKGRPRRVTALALSGDGRLASSDNALLRLYDWKAKALIKESKLIAIVDALDFEPRSGLPSISLLAEAERGPKGEVYRWRLDTGRVQRQLGRRTNAPSQSAQVLPVRAGTLRAQWVTDSERHAIVEVYKAADDRELIHTRQPRTLRGPRRRLWTAPKGDKGKRLGARRAALGARGRVLALLRPERLLVIDLETGATIFKLEDAEGELHAVDMDASGKRLAVGTGLLSFGRLREPQVKSLGLTKIYELPTGKLIATLGDKTPSGGAPEPRILDRVCLSPDGRFVANSAGELWEIDSGRLVSTFSNDWKSHDPKAAVRGFYGEHACAFTADSAHLIRVAGAGPRVSKHRCADGAELGSRELDGLPGRKRYTIHNRPYGVTLLDLDPFAGASIDLDAGLVALTETLRIDGRKVVRGASFYELSSGRRLGVVPLEASNRQARVRLAPGGAFLERRVGGARLRDTTSSADIAKVYQRGPIVTEIDWRVMLSPDGGRLIAFGEEAEEYQLRREGVDPSPPALIETEGDAAFKNFQPLYEELGYGVVRAGPEMGRVRALSTD